MIAARVIVHFRTDLSPAHPGEGRDPVRAIRLVGEEMARKGRKMDPGPTAKRSMRGLRAFARGRRDERFWFIMIPPIEACEP